MNPVTLIGNTFVLVGREWRLIIGANWWILLVFFGSLVGSSWLALRLLDIMPHWASAEFVQATGTAIALFPLLLTLIATGVVASRISERLGEMIPGQSERSLNLKRWIMISGLIFLALAGIEIGHARYLELLAQRGDYEFQGIIFMMRHYANIAVFFVGLGFLVAVQSRVGTMVGVQQSNADRRWGAYLAIMVAGLIVYMSVEPAIEQIFLYLPPMGFFWATFDRLQPSYFFLTESARLGAQTLAPIIYASFIVVAGEAVRRVRT